MKRCDPRNTTFAQLDELDGIPASSSSTEEEFPLPTWYREMRDIPLGQLTIKDISRACRQSIHLDQVIPIALDFLEADPLAGEIFDGELLVAMKAVPFAYWRDNQTQRDQLLDIIHRCKLGLSGDIKKDADDLVKRLESV